jgi:hypothetical protein
MNDQSKKKDQHKMSNELIAGYVEGILSDREKQLLESCLSSCADERELLRIQLDVARQQKMEELAFVPEELTQRAKDLVRTPWGANIFEIVIRFSDDFYEALQTSGKILRGPDLTAAELFRGQGKRKAKTLLMQKAFDRCNVEVEASRECSELNTISLRIINQKRIKLTEHLQITLKKDNQALECHPVVKGKVVFENVKPGQYTIEIVEAHTPIGAVSLQLTKL